MYLADNRPMTSVSFTNTLNSGKPSVSNASQLYSGCTCYSKFVTSPLSGLMACPGRRADNSLPAPVCGHH